MGWLSKIKRMWGRGFKETVDASIDRANVRVFLPKDMALLVPAASRKVIRERFEWCLENFGLLQGAIAGIARGSVGEGISLQLNTNSPEWDALAEADFELYATTPDRCDLAGIRNFYEAQLFAIEQFSGPGEFFARFTENPRWEGEPCFQLFDANEIDSPKDNTDESIIDGVRVDSNYAHVSYFALTQTKNGPEYVEYPANQFVHWYKPPTANAPRAVSPFAPALNRLIGMYELENLTIKSAKAHQLYAVHLKGMEEERKSNLSQRLEGAGTGRPYDSRKDTAAMEKLAKQSGAAIIGTGKDGEVKIVSNTQPSPLIEQFFSGLLLRDIYAAPGVPIEYFWAPEKLNSGNIRFVLQKADGLFRGNAGALIEKFIRKVIFLYLSNRIEKGFLPPPPDPDWAKKMGFQRPAKVTIDNARDTKARIDMINEGVQTLRDWCDELGIPWRPQLVQWLREIKFFIDTAIKMQLPQAYIDRLIANLPIWRGGMPGVAMPVPDEPEPEPEPTPEPAPAPRPPTPEQV